ncbi:MAG: hypothetical protein H6Q13_3506 [Bacteroidetes bacterium]|nr:hypothetical protein [Bacteroidota bacterium]
MKLDRSILGDEQKILVATIYGESAGCSLVAWEAIANVIVNRVGNREWSRYNTVTKVIQDTGFDAYTYQNAPYKEAIQYLNNRDGSNQRIEQLIKIVLPVYNRERMDVTGGAVLYYSPKAQEQLANENPRLYSRTPEWNFDVLELVNVSGAENDDLKFYKYR